MGAIDDARLVMDRNFEQVARAFLFGNAWCDTHNEYEEIKAVAALLRGQVTAALKQFGTHHASCDKYRPEETRSGGACTCGLDLLADQPIPLKDGTGR